MRASNNLLVLTLIASPLGLYAQGAEPLANRLEQAVDYLQTAQFEVLLPSAQDPVTYDIILQSTVPELTDSLAPCDYVIRWQAQAPEGPVSGFSAYFNGHHYRFRNNRLQEYHATDNIEPFMPRGNGSQLRYGVQCQAQFADLLPQFLGAKVREITADSAYIWQLHPDTLVSGQRSIVLDGIKRTAGYDSQYFTYVFDYETVMPRTIDLEMSPGSISEQIMTVRYKPVDGDVQPIVMSEEGLIAEWPEAFEKYRESTFKAESLLNNPLPQFYTSTLGGERYNYQRGQGFLIPTIIVALDPEVATTQSTIAAIRESVQSLPMPVQVIWAIVSNHESEIKELLGDLGPDETALVSVSSLVRNTGITMYPTILICNAKGLVQDVILGYNNDLSSIVIQKCISTH